MHRQKGFTFIELIVVIAIASIVSGIAVPIYFNLRPSMQVNGAARQIMGDLMWARMKAVSENNDYVVTFGTATNSYNIYDDDNGSFTLPNTSPYTVENSELVKTINISDKYDDIEYGFVPGMQNMSGDILAAGSSTVTFSPAAGLVWFKFSPNGQSNKNGSVYIIPSKDKDNGNEDRTRLVTTITTGRVMIKRYDPATDEWK